ncbi:MAG: AAA-like domain-containing protein [Planctomycetes bacterium]|nr:AAA-like domain-containing protein [Planctomycetota bacterium]
MGADIAQADFFIAGGTLQRSAPSYVTRPADRQLYEGLVRGDFCYVLTSRQMGKSSLMVRTANRLQEAGVTVVVLDLTAIGQNLDLEKWYGGLLAIIGQQLDLDDELDDFWWDNPAVGPLQRWMSAIREVVLPRCQRLVVFVDEIDVVRSLPFSTDEFFAAIRACHNQRADDPELQGLTFCLLGVATPSDLIRDPRMTPFNIGSRIELEDFTPEDAEPLREGLAADASAGRILLQRILYWTGGHPYLTQRLCRAVAADAQATTPADVDRICQTVFLSPAARQHDSNLLFVRERLLHSGGDLAALLDVYQRIHRGQRVRKDERNPTHGKLQLAGVTRTEGGILRVRNRIYERVFDREWIQASMPDAELRRQRAAFRRGLLRASLAASVIILLLTGFAVYALHQRQQAERARSEAVAALEQARRAQRDAEVARDEADLQRTRAETEAKRAEEQAMRAENARQDEERQRDVAVRQREEADRQRAIAVETQKELENALAAAKVAEQSARAAEQRAETARKKAVDEQQRAEEAERQAIAEAKRAEDEKRIAVRNAELAQSRGRLFEKLIPMLQEHATEGVRRYALEQEKEGEPLEALESLVQFGELALENERGFLARELLQIAPQDLEGLDEESTGVTISVPRQALFQQVVSPGIELGEKLLKQAEHEGAALLLAQLYAFQARIISQGSDLNLGANVAPTELIFRSYDRAVELQSDHYGHYLGRAVARFRLPDRDLTQVLEDLDAAIRLHPAVLQTASGAEAAPADGQELAQLHDARANVLEFLADGASSKQRLQLLEKAEEAHRQAQAIDRRSPHYLVGLARVKRKLSAAAERPSSEDLRAGQSLLEEAIALDPKLHAAYNELGEIHLFRGKIAEARRVFQQAVEEAEESKTQGSLYTYYCNLANACTRDPADSAVLMKALQAAEKAVALDATTQPDAHFYRAVALQKLDRDRQALEALDKVLELDPNHVQGLLTRCQVVYEMRPAAREEEIRKAYADMSRVLRTAELTREERAKANYVYSLAWLRYHLQQRSDDSLVKCQDYALKAAKESPAYLPYARQIFQHAATHAFQSVQLREESQKLQNEFRSLTTSTSVGAD